MKNEPMSYEELLRRGVDAQMRGNEELSKALFSRAMDIEAEGQRQNPGAETN